MNKVVLLLSQIVLISALSLRSNGVAPKVPVELYFESYCPGCENFIRGPLKEVYSKEDMKEIMDLKLYPYGNAHTLTRDPPTFQCQHGEKECYGNYVEDCAIEHNPNNWFNFMVCIETSVDFSDEGVTKCANEVGIDANTILTCAKGEEGPLLHLAAGDATPKEHKWVPWVVINGEVTESFDQFQKLICDAYTGEKPKSCLTKSMNEVAPKVPVELYFESYCPGCESFITSILNYVYSKEDMKEIMDLKLYPYGNARTLTRDPPTFQCQHGEKECYGNYVEDCAIEHNPNNWFPFIVCIETSVDFSDKGVTKCANEVGIDANVILTCAKGEEGPLLHLAAGDATPKDHQWVPWVVVNGKMTEDEDNLLQLVCDAYTGEKPKSCSTKVTKA